MRRRHALTFGRQASHAALPRTVMCSAPAAIHLHAERTPGGQIHTRLANSAAIPT